MIRSESGYSLIELIVVIGLIGILAVMVVPRFQGTGGYAEYAYQARLISSLRAMQQRAMQDSRGTFCYRVNINFGVSSNFGPPTIDYADDANQALSCTTGVDESLDYMSASAADLADDGVTLSGGSGTLTVEFDGLGCPVGGASACSTAINVAFDGDTSAGVCIESQGYIHAC